MSYVLITGSNGLLGQKLVYLLKNQPSVDLIATAVGENRLPDKNGYQFESMDITNSENIQQVFNKYKPTHVKIGRAHV